LNGSDLTKRIPDRWVIDFGVTMTERDASMYELPFAYIESKVKGQRASKRETAAARKWWLHQRPRPEMRAALNGLSRCIVTPRVSRHRIFAWMPTSVLPDSRLVVFARDDDTTFGILQSRFHANWAIRKGMKHGVGNDPQYTPTEGFETFAFPEGLTPDVPAASYVEDIRAKNISAAAIQLDTARRTWLYPADLVGREPEIAVGFPERIVPKDDDAAIALRARTLSVLYATNPAWLRNLHSQLDAAVASAYGWPEDISDDAALIRLLDLNRQRSQPAIIGLVEHSLSQRTAALPG
jgi:type II restriction/modification system DNA methylase subunit YeeA